MNAKNISARTRAPLSRWKRPPRVRSAVWAVVFFVHPTSVRARVLARPHRRTSPPRSNHVVVVNVHGGFPSCYVTAAIDHLEVVRTMRTAGARVCTRVYPTSACAAATLHDWLMDAPAYAMTDECWYPWSRSSVAMRSLFGLFKAQGYTTHLLGAYGLEMRFDPQRTLRPAPCRLETALAHLGVDHFDAEDGAFATRPAIDHDLETLARLEARVRAWPAAEKHVAIVNLLGCRDVERCSWADATHDARVPTLCADRWLTHTEGDDEPASLPVTALDDDPRAWTETPTRARAGLRRLARLHDDIKGEASVPPPRAALVRALNALHRHAWATLRRLDAPLASLAQALLPLRDGRGGTLVLLADRALSLYEHGAMADAPWDACTRCFMVECSPATRARPPPVDTTPRGMGVLHDALVACAGLQLPVGWHTLPAASAAALTLSVAPSHMARAAVPPAVDAFAMPFMWARIVAVHDERLVALVFWWSIDDLARGTLERPDAWNAATPEQRALLAAQRTMWKIPLVDGKSCRAPDAAYDLSIDPGEAHNLAESDAWCAGDECASLRRQARDVVVAHGLDRPLRLTLTPEACLFGARTTHHPPPQSMPQPPAPSAAARVSQHAQTDAAVHFSRPLVPHPPSLPTEPIEETGNGGGAPRRVVQRAPSLPRRQSSTRGTAARREFALHERHR